MTVAPPAMKEIYPQRASLPTEFLVPPAFQPEFRWSEQEAARALWNAGREIDAVASSGVADKPAFISLGEGRTWTYSQLKSESDRLAGALVDLGLQIGDRVAIYTPSNGNHVVSVLAVWKAGGAIVPLPQQSRADDLRIYLDDSRPRFVITDAGSHFVGELSAVLPTTPWVERVVVGGGIPSGNLLGAESLETLIAEGDQSRLADIRTEANDIACVWHTGGTTGRPKGSYHTHRRWTVAAQRLKETWGLGPEHVWLHAMPMGNVAGTLGRFLQALLHGATLVEPKSLAPEALLEAIVATGVTHLLGVPVTLASLADLVQAAGGARAIPALSQVYAPLLSSAAREVYDAWKDLGFHLSNPYGNSVLCEWAIGPRSGQPTPPFAMGRAAQGYECRIVHVEGDQLTDAAIGETGRIAIQGATGATYWRRPDIQAQEIHDGWTVTDDLGLMDGDGHVWFMGRLNDLIVTSGFKVAPGEVEEALVRHPLVQEVKATGVPDARRGEVVAAFIALKDGVAGTDSLVTELQEWVKQETAPYKYPRAVIFKERLPRDVLGKIQTRILVDEYVRGLADQNSSAMIER